METTKAVPQKASYRGVFFAVALLGVYSLPAAASSGIDVNCEAVEDRQPSESLEVTDLSLTVDLSRSIEETVDEIETTVAQRDPVRLE
ncbi:MAG: hypothetical protein KJO82_04390, partial [Gammaproteobacteria bacterium]|nr:hypothetical protein [Gammaproteobacteria bacterium]